MLNTKLLRKVKKHILAVPARLRMSNWLLTGVSNQAKPLYGDQSGGGECNSYGESIEEVKIPECGAVGCIAGWTCKISGRSGALDYVDAAAQLLGISVYTAAELFYVDNWPVGLTAKYKKARTQKTRAKIVGEVIDQFIKKFAK